MRAAVIDPVRFLSNAGLGNGYSHAVAAAKAPDRQQEY
jgi:hypothetical protein